MKFSTLLVGVLFSVGSAQLLDDIEFEEHPSKMPFKVSDITANYMEGDNGDEDGFIIITGGCDAENGNERLAPDLFACTSTSTKTLKFDPFTGTFESMADAPHPRQRHAAAVSNGELYVFGGRDSDDILVPEIDAFNPKTNTWTTRGVLPLDVVTSDLAAWSWNDFVYVSGGFDVNYTAIAKTYRLELSGNPTSFEAMGFQNVAPPPVARGDMHAVVQFGYAYLAGGITHENLWCEGLADTERYHMETDTWETLSNLDVGRADMAVAVLNGKILAIGGETKPDNCVDIADPAFGSFPQDHVEVLLDTSGSASDAKWVQFADFHDQRFRFAAASVPAQNRLYTFGGQLPFDFTCDCFPTSDLVGVGTEVFEKEPEVIVVQKSDKSEKRAIIIASVFGAIGFIVIAAYLVRRCSQKNHAGGDETGEFATNKAASMQ